LKKELVNRILSHQEGDGNGNSSTPILAVDCMEELELEAENDDEDKEVVSKE
jgi:hypothetical protein